ncbi:NAD(P)H-binding protein, partial [Vibrio parahaemolyticus]|nr:NAD(P)H-binding protein [Vibrio parahaemolyticus]
MSLLLLGVSSQGVGLNIAEKAIAQGIKVTAVVRRQGVADYLREQGATVLHADAVEVGVLDQACQLTGSNATVVSTLCG